MVRIDLENIYKKYEDAKKFSVSDFNLNIKDREFVVFVGPSGCGKSTTLRMIAGLEDITQGNLKIGGELMNEVAPKDRDIAMVFQNYALYPQMTVYDNMAFGLKLRKYSKSEIDERVKNAAEILGLNELLHRKPAALSGGQRQRVALGRAIVRDAKVFLMDEPLSNLDAKLRVAMRAEITKLHRRLNTTTIYVTHDQTEAMTMADRIVIMKDGLVQQIGTPEEVYNSPKNVFVASFIGSPAMNFLNVEYSNGKIIAENGFNIKLPAEMGELLSNKGYEGKQLIFGIRPEDIEINDCELGLNNWNTVEAEVVVSELLGAERILYSKIGEAELISKVGAKLVHEPGDSVMLSFKMDKAHFFDIDTEVAVN